MHHYDDLRTQPTPSQYNADPRAKRKYDLSHRPSWSWINRLFRYRKTTGELVYRVSRGRAGAGSEAGCRHVHGYWFIRIDGRKLPRCHVIWMLHRGFWPASPLYHINGNPSDDHIENLSPLNPRNKADAKREASHAHCI